jgi:hypothetical protein
LINVTKHDSRISFLGNASLGQAWFRWDQVNYGTTNKRRLDTKEQMMANYTSNEQPLS